uniref:Uncharacterized protein n=1 Tax=Romanomermis culicivorax TaxID=13658 RepID=A0A915JL02_ROMCU
MMLCAQANAFKSKIVAVSTLPGILDDVKQAASDAVDSVKNAAKDACTKIASAGCGESNAFLTYKCCDDDFTKCCYALTPLSIILIVIAAVVIGLSALIGLCCCCCNMRR